MKWRKGDLGRFESEDRSLPRFEVIQAKKGEHVEVWYGGSPTTTLIPWDIFFKECTNFWDWKLDVIVPAWLAPDREFVAKGTFVQACVPYRNAKMAVISVDHQTATLNSERLLVRSVRHDHASCLILPDGPLILVSVNEAIESRQTTAWSRLLDNDIFEEDRDEDDLAKIFG